jgi:hypothetical protein
METIPAQILITLIDALVIILTAAALGVSEKIDLTFGVNQGLRAQRQNGSPRLDPVNPYHAVVAIVIVFIISVMFIVAVPIVQRGGK